MKQEMMRWQLHQQDRMKIIRTSLQTDVHTSTSAINVLQAGYSTCRPTDGVKALRTKLTILLNFIKTRRNLQLVLVISHRHTDKMDSHG